MMSTASAAATGDSDVRVAAMESVKDAMAKSSDKGDEKVRLVYFNARGRAEVIRLLLEDAAVQYDDVRFMDGEKGMEQFNEYKSTGQLPFGQVPILIENGKILAQSSAILRHLGRLFGYMGDSEADTALIDMIVCGVEDLKLRFATSVAADSTPDRSKDVGSLLSEKKLPIDFVTVTLPQWAGYLEQQLLESDGPYFCSKFSVADLVLFEAFHSFWLINHDFLDWDRFPKLKKHFDVVLSRPRISAWLRSRPVTAV